MLLALALVGCAPTLDREDCVSTWACQTAFGYAYTCGDAGYCEAVDAPARCAETTPPNFFDSDLGLDDTVLAATVFDLSTDVSEEQAAVLAVQQANENGGVDGLSVSLVHCNYEENSDLDELTRDEAATQIAGFLAERVDVSAVVGPGSSQVAVTMWEAFQADSRAGNPLLISPSATSSALTFIDGTTKTDDEPGTFWRTAPPDDLQAQAIAQDIRDQLGVTDVAVIAEAGPYGDGLLTEFERIFADGTHTVTSSSFANASQLSTAVATMAADDAPVVLFISSQVTEAIAFLEAINTVSGYEGRTLYFTDGASDTRLLTEASEASAFFGDIRGTRPTNPAGAVYDAFDFAYALAYEGGNASDSAWTAYSYDAGWLAIYGMTWSSMQEDLITPIGSARGLRKLSGGAAHTIDATSYAAIEDAFASGLGVDVTGASGELDYDANEETSAPVDIWQVGSDDASIEIIGTCLPSGACNYTP